MRKKGGLSSFILVVATLAAVAALIVAHMDKIHEFLDTCRKTAEEAGRSCRCGCNGGASAAEDESDFEDVVL